MLNITNSKTDVKVCINSDGIKNTQSFENDVHELKNEK